MYRETLDSYARHFYDGFSDGTEDEKADLQPISGLDNHPDPIYATGYKAGRELYALQVPSDTAWLQFIAGLILKSGVANGVSIKKLKECFIEENETAITITGEKFSLKLRKDLTQS